KEIADKQKQVEEVQKEVNELKKEKIEVKEEILLQSFGLYEPQYDFSSSEIYKQELTKIRDKQKEMVKKGTASTAATNWTVNNSVSEGKKMLKDMQKLLLMAFNSECDEIISKVKINNIETAEKRITSSKDA